MAKPTSSTYPVDALCDASRTGCALRPDPELEQGRPGEEDGQAPAEAISAMIVPRPALGISAAGRRASATCVVTAASR
jgi:hypothetical protein